MVHWRSRCTSIFYWHWVCSWICKIFLLLLLSFSVVGFFFHARKGRGWWRKLVDKLLWTIIKYQMYFLSLTYCSIFPLDKSIYTIAQKFFSAKLSSIDCQCMLKENTTKRNAALFLDAIWLQVYKGALLRQKHSWLLIFYLCLGLLLIFPLDSSFKIKSCAMVACWMNNLIADGSKPLTVMCEYEQLGYWEWIHNKTFLIKRMLP